MAEYVDLSERVSATFYSDEYEEWTQQTVTIADVLDSVCDNYTVLPSAQPDVTDINVGDIISRQAAIDAVSNALDRQTLLYGFVRKVALDAIKNLPTVQPGRKKGHWVEIGDEPYDEWECDMCGFVIDGSGCIDPEEYRDVYKFCPNCGVKMQKEGEQMAEYKSGITGRIEEWWKKVCIKHNCKYYIHQDYPKCSYCTCPNNCILVNKPKAESEGV